MKPARLATTTQTSGTCRIRIEEPSDVRDSLPVALLVVAEDGSVSYANRRAGDVLHRTPESMLNEPIENVLAPLEDLVESAISADEDRARRRLRIDGNERVIGFRATRIDDRGGYTVVFRDITSWDELSSERDRLMQLAGVSEVLPAILHELRNPLSAMATSLELMLEETSGQRAREDLHAILGEVRRTLLTLDGLGSVDHCLHDSRHHAVDLAIREVCRVLESQAQSRSMTLCTDVANMPLLQLNRAVIRALTFNLVTNALHAGHPGGTVTVSARLRDGELELAVRDDGEGMTLGVLDRCKELFFTTKAKGTGIGLALCDRVVRAARGGFDIISAPGAGTEVVLTVPLTPPPHGENPSARTVRFKE